MTTFVANEFKIDTAQRDETCSVCGEAFGHRKIARIKPTGQLVHKTCSQQMMEQLHEAERAELRKTEEYAQARREAERANRRFDRNGWDKFLELRLSDDGDHDELHLAYQCRKIQDRIDGHEARVEKFAAELLKNPQYTMSWSRDMFEHAAKYDLAVRVKAYVEEGRSASEITEWAQQEANRAMGNMSSTSVTSNAAEHYWGQACIDFVRGNGYNL